MKNRFKYFSKFFENQKKRQISRDLTVDMASQLAKLGIEKTIFFLLSQENNKFAIARERAFTFRPRYQKIRFASVSDVNNSTSAMKTIHPNIVNMPFKYFLNPIGIGHFSDLYEKVDRSIRIQNVISYINATSPLPETMKVRRFEEQAIASLIFHSEIASAYENSFSEADVNPGAIDSEVAFKKIVAGSKASPEIKHEAIRFFANDENFKLAIERLSAKAQVRVRR